MKSLWAGGARWRRGTVAAGCGVREVAEFALGATDALARVMSYDERNDVSDDVLLDVTETEEEASQRRGRERMISLWRSAVASVAEAAQRETALADDHGGASNDVEGYEAPAPVIAVTRPAPPTVAAATTTWVFPTKSASDAN